MQSLWHVSFPYWQFVLRGAIVYFSILILLRLGGKRQIGQMGAGEFVAILLISNAVQNSMNGGDNSVTGGLILAFVIIVSSVFIEWLTYRSRKWETIIQGRPTVLIHHGRIQQHNLDRERLSAHELRAILRRQGIHDIHEVATAILESDGYVSVTKQSELNHNDQHSQSQPEEG